MKGADFARWLAAAGSNRSRCPACRRTYRGGHADDCVVLRVGIAPLTAAGARRGGAYPISFRDKTCDRKLAPLTHQAYTNPNSGHKYRRPQPRRPFCCATYVPIKQTCPNTCRFKYGPNGQSGACFVGSGFTRHLNEYLEAAGDDYTPTQIALIEAMSVDLQFPNGVPQDGGKFGFSGRDLRWHIGGDVPNEKGARAIAAAQGRYLERGGGTGWGYTHRWRTLPREAFGPISIWASVEKQSEVIAARRRGYPLAVTVLEFPNGDKPFRFGRTIVVPCPAETRGRTCVECRLCLEPPKPFAKGKRAIGFALHGIQSSRVRLPVLR